MIFLIIFFKKKRTLPAYVVGAEGRKNSLWLTDTLKNKTPPLYHGRFQLKPNKKKFWLNDHIQTLFLELSLGQRHHIKSNLREGEGRIQTPINEAKTYSYRNKLFEYNTRNLKKIKSE